MKAFNPIFFALFGVTLSSCAAVVPQELAGARQAFQRASNGPAARLTPAELHKAEESLREAELAFSREPKAYHTRDLAYVAERKAQMAEAAANVVQEQQNSAKSKQEYNDQQGRNLAQSRKDLEQSKSAADKTNQQLAAEKQQLAAEKKARAEDEKHAEAMRGAAAGQLADEKAAREQAEKRAADAQAALAKMSEVKQEPRGMVITLSGSVLFASDKAVLLPEAQARLSQVAAALLTTKERTIVVEGHSDSRGSEVHNLDLSQRRANAVREFIVSKGYEPDRITARGIGKGRPIADNGTAEGRANNRRVEIVIANETALNGR